MARNAGTEAEQRTMMVEANKQTDQEGTVFIKLIPSLKIEEEHSAADTF